MYCMFPKGLLYVIKNKGLTLEIPNKIILTRPSLKGQHYKV